MSFVIAYSFDSIGFILADTRLNATYDDGTTSVNDGERSVITLGNHETVVFGLQHRKMAPVNGGYCANAGEAITGRKVLDSLIGAPYSSLSERALLVSAESRRIAPWLPQSPHTNDQLKKSVIMVLDGIDEKVKLSTINMAGSIQHQNANYTIFWPPEIEINTFELLSNRAINVSPPPLSIRQLYKRILQTLQLFNMVYKNSHSVSATFEIGVLVSQPDGFVKLYGAGNSDDFSGVGIDAVKKILINVDN